MYAMLQCLNWKTQSAYTLPVGKICLPLMFDHWKSVFSRRDNSLHILLFRWIFFVGEMLKSEETFFFLFRSNPANRYVIFCALLKGPVLADFLCDMWNLLSNFFVYLVERGKIILKFRKRTFDNRPGHCPLNYFYLWLVLWAGEI